MSWFRLMLVAMLVSLTGCAALRDWSRGEKPPTSRSESLERMDPARIQADTMGFADRFVAAMTGVCDNLERRAPTPAVRDSAHQFKTDLALGAISNAVNPHPVAGLMDMVVLVTLVRQIAQDPWSTQTFGDDASLLVEALQQQEADIRAMASRYLTDPQLTELDRLAQRWRLAHPDDRSVSHVHLANLPEANRPPEVGADLPGSIFGLLFFDPTANLDPAVREVELSRATSERMFFYLQRMPLLLKLQGESFYRQLLETDELQRTLADVSAVAGSTTRFAEASSRFTDTVGRFPEQLSEERSQALAQVAAEMTHQRDAAIRQFADAVAEQREAAITRATTRIAAERQQAIEQMAAALRQEQQAFVSNLEAAAKRSLTRLAGWGLLVLGLALAGVLAYRRLARRAVI